MKSLAIKDLAREIFLETLAQLDPAQALRRAVQWDGARLLVSGETFVLPPGCPVYAVALGKAALPLAQALDEMLGARLASGVVSAPDAPSSQLNPLRWRTFAGGHPVPNADSLRAAQAAFALLRRADAERALVFFLISGGGSAMLDYPADESLSLQDLQNVNQSLVNCGASIAEINAVRRALSAVKGGGLARAAPNATQISLIISDTNPGDIASVASGPTLPAPSDAPCVDEILTRYDLRAGLPASALALLASVLPAAHRFVSGAVYVLLDQNSALQAAAQSAAQKGVAVARATDVVEQPVCPGARLLWESLVRQYEVYASGNVMGRGDIGFGIVSAGEFACPVRGTGQGGRNSETALHLALLLDEKKEWLAARELRVVGLCAGTDGVDGNSPAAGAWATDDTLTRARAQGLDAHDFLARSDSYNFFATLGDALSTGPTGTNVRDVRILLAVRDNCVAGRLRRA